MLDPHYLRDRITLDVSWLINMFNYIWDIAKYNWSSWMTLPVDIRQVKITCDHEINWFYILDFKCNIKSAYKSLNIVLPYGQKIWWKFTLMKMPPIIFLKIWQILIWQIDSMWWACMHAWHVTIDLSAVSHVFWVS